MRHLASGLTLLLCWVDLSAAGQQTFAGHRLDEALRLLQQAGLPIVFSSEVVTPSMIVSVEPSAQIPRQQLDELLAPHALKAEPGPGRVILIVRNRSGVPRVSGQGPRSPAADARPRSPASAPEKEPTRYVDQVTVWGDDEAKTKFGVSATTLSRVDLQTATSVLASDGLEAIRVMPGVFAADDFRTGFSVRGSPYRQIGIVVDGVATPWLQHAVYGRDQTGSLSMFGSDVVDRVTLQAGAYPRRNGDALGAQIDVRLKEGSRDSMRLTARAGGTSAAVDGEGPLGSNHRGSWIAGVRNSYRTWPPRRLSQNDVGFAFGDAHAKLVYDISDAHQLSVSALAGRSTLDTVDEPLVGPLGYGTNRGGLFGVTLRSAFSSRTVVRQQVSFVGQDLMSALPTGQVLGRSKNLAFEYRGEVLHAIAGGLLEGGTEVARVSGAHDREAISPGVSPASFHATWTTRAAYVNFQREVGRALSLEAGARASDSTLVHHNAVAPWLRAAWKLKPTWTFTASTGGSDQFATLDVVRGLSEARNLAPERATNIDLGVEQRLPTFMWSTTFFHRKEHDVLDRPEFEASLLPSVALARSIPYRNLLSGTSRGLVLLVSRTSAARWSGWSSYTYAIARQTDSATRQTFSSDFDRRHALNAAGTLRLGDHTIVGLVLRAASGIPVPGSFRIMDRQLAAADQRNRLRLSPYVRLDTRVQRSFVSSSHAVTIFGEVLNVLNRQNLGLCDSLAQPITGEAELTRPLLPRRVSVGVEVRLGR